MLVYNLNKVRFPHNEKIAASRKRNWLILNGYIEHFLYITENKEIKYTVNKDGTILWGGNPLYYIVGAREEFYNSNLYIIDYEFQSSCLKAYHNWTEIWYRYEICGTCMSNPLIKSVCKL